MTQFWVKFWLRVSKKTHHVKSGEILSNSCSVSFGLILAQIDKNAFEISSFFKFHFLMVMLNKKHSKYKRH